MTTQFPLRWIQQQAAFNTTQVDVDSALITSGTFKKTMYSICTDSANNLYVAYTTRGALPGKVLSGVQDVVISKFDTSGNYLFSIQDASLNAIGAYRSWPTISVDTADNIYVGCYSTTPTRIIIGKYTSSGSRIFVISDNSFNIGSTVNYCGNILIDSAGVPWISAGYGPGSIGDVDSFIFSLNTDGSLRSITTDSSFSTTTRDFFQISADCESSLYLFSTSLISTPSTYRIAQLYKINKATGIAEWHLNDALINAYTPTNSPCIALTSDKDNAAIGLLLVTSNSPAGSYSGSGVDILLFKVATDGTLLWSKQFPSGWTSTSDFGTTDTRVASSLTTDHNGNIYILQTIGSTTTTTDLNLFVYSSNGALLFNNSLPSMNTLSTEFVPMITFGRDYNLYVGYHTDGAVSGGVQTGNGDLVVASYRLADVTLTTSVSPVGAGSILILPPALTMKIFSTVSLTAIPNTGQYLYKWTGDYTSGDTAFTLLMDTSKNLTAVFRNAATPATNGRSRVYRQSSNELTEGRRTCVCGTGSHEVIVKSNATGRCCDYYAVIGIQGEGGSGFSLGAVYELVGGTPIDKPALIRIMSVSGGGSVTLATVLYAGVYSVKPSSNTFKNIATGTTTAIFTPVWSPVTLTS